MSDLYSDVMDDLMEDTAEGPARSGFDAGDDFDELDEFDAGDSGDEADDEFLSRIIGGIGQAVGGLAGADEFDAYDEFGAGDGFEDQADVDSVEDAVADALDASDTDEFLRRLRRIAGGALNVARRVGRGVGQVARVVGPIASMIPIPQAQAIGRIANIAGRLLADGADEFEAIDELVDTWDEDSIDAAAPVIAGLTIRRVMPGVSRMPRQARRQLVRGVTQATRTVVRRQGAPAARAVPRIVRSAQRAVRQRQLPARAVPQAVRRAAVRVARSPRAAQQLARPLARPGAPGAARRRTGGSPRRFRLTGPVTITIQGR